MRTWTLVLSVCAHAIAIAAILVAPIFATTDLPEPRRPLTFQSLTIVDVPEVPVRPRVQPPETPATATASSVPLTEPIEIRPEPARPLPDRFSDIGVPGATGVPIGDSASIGDLVPPPPPPASLPEPPVRVGGRIQPPSRVVYVEPIYPQLAIASRTQGIVILEAVIDEEGSVNEVRILRGHPLLHDAARTAVSRWRFTPTLLNGAPVPVVMTVTVAFALTK
jgi:periplasmic protein TonB